MVAVVRDVREEVQEMDGKGKSGEPVCEAGPGLKVKRQYIKQNIE